MEEIRIGGLVFKIYQTAGGTWQAYVRLAGRPKTIHRKEKDVIEAARAFADGKNVPLPERVTIAKSDKND